MFPLAVKDMTELSRRNEAIMKVFRYKRIDLFFCFTFFMAFSCLWYIVYCNGREKQYLIDAEKYSYRYYTLIDIQNFEGLLDISTVVGNKEAVIYLEGVGVYFDDLDAQMVANIVLSERYPNEYSGDIVRKAATRNGLLMGGGCDRLNSTSKNTLRVDGVDIPYSGKIGSTYSGYNANTIFIPYSILGESTKKRISQSSSVRMVICSDDLDTTEMANLFVECLGKTSTDCEFIVGPYSLPAKSEEIHNEKTLFIFLFVFTVFSCFIATELWIWSRRNELSVHLIYGYKWMRLYFHCCLDGLKLGGLSWIAAFVVFAMVRIISKEFYIAIFITNTRWISFLLYSIMCICICILVQFINLMRNPSISQVIKAGGE